MRNRPVLYSDAVPTAVGALAPVGSIAFGPGCNGAFVEANDLQDFYRQYLAVAVFVGAALVMVGAMLGVGALLRPTRPQAEKYITYESGSDPFGQFGQQNVRYYLYALLFVIFDVETVFLFPWAIGADGADQTVFVDPHSGALVGGLGWFGFVEIAIFTGILVAGLAYLWRKGLLKWA